jgi:hypothetical protein
MLLPNEQLFLEHYRATQERLEDYRPPRQLEVMRKYLQEDRGSGQVTMPVSAPRPAWLDQTRLAISPALRTLADGIEPSRARRLPPVTSSQH